MCGTAVVFPDICLWFLLLMQLLSHVGGQPADEDPQNQAVRVDCTTPGLMKFQISDSRIRTLLQSPQAVRLHLFSEHPRDKRPIETCSDNHTISHHVSQWSRPFSFLTYDTNSTCVFRSNTLENEEGIQHVYIADIFVKVISAVDGTGVGRRGQIRLTCTMLATPVIETRKTEIITETPLPYDKVLHLPNEDLRSKAPDVVLDTLGSQLQGSLTLRFFKSSQVPGKTIPATSVTEGDHVYLVAALRPGGTFSALRPIKCTIRSVKHTTQHAKNVAPVGEFIHILSGADKATVQEYLVIENGCQSPGFPWNIPAEAATKNISRLFYTKLLAPLFPGSTKLSAKCSINLCTPHNIEACLNAPRPLMKTGCITLTDEVPDFQISFNSLTGISDLRPAEILMVSSAIDQSLRPPLVPGHASFTRHGTPSPNAETKEDKGLFKRNITHGQRVVSSNSTMNISHTQSRWEPVLPTPGSPFGLTGANAEIIKPSSSTTTSLSTSQEVKYCFLQSTVTAASVTVVFVFILSIILVTFAVFAHCKKPRPDATAILHDLN